MDDARLTADEVDEIEGLAKQMLQAVTDRALVNESYGWDSIRTAAFEGTLKLAAEVRDLTAKLSAARWHVGFLQSRVQKADKRAERAEAGMSQQIAEATGDAGSLARELITLVINGERGEAEQRVKDFVSPDENWLEVTALVMVMADALAQTWGTPEAWQAQMLEIEGEGS